MLKRKKSLPPKAIIRFGKFTWTTLWNLMMAQMAPRSSSGDYLRPQSQFRQRVSSTSHHPYPPEKGRYSLYVGYGCPWAHRTLIVRALKGLEEAIAVTLVTPAPLEGGWIIPAQNNRPLAHLYQEAEANYTGRYTVPILWDSQSQTIVNNESAEIIEILNSEFNEFAQNPNLNLYPQSLQATINDWNKKIYATVNNGVYRCGFAQTQSAYETACQSLFSTLDEIDQTLSKNRYLCGATLTLADVRLLTTLIRFDLVYYSLFKCSQKRIQDYLYLGDYLRELYQIESIQKTCHLKAIHQEYYGNLFPLNPGGIIPIFPKLDYLSQPHNRHVLSVE